MSSLSLKSRLHMIRAMDLLDDAELDALLFASGFLIGAHATAQSPFLGMLNAQLKASEAKSVEGADHIANLQGFAEALVSIDGEDPEAN